MMRFLAGLSALCLLPGSAAAQVQLSLVEGAACAQSSATIEMLEKYNTDLYNEIGELQASSDRVMQSKANSLLVHHERMAALRRSLITDYELVCARGSMTYTDFRKVCTPLSSGQSFADTVFCRPLKEAQQ